MFKKSIKLSVPICISFFFAGSILITIKPSIFADSNSSGKIIVEVTGLRNNDGKALVVLYNNSNGFPGSPEKNSRIKSMEGTISNNKSTVVFTEIPYGTYAVFVLHDENNNKTMDFSQRGIPKEGMAYSQNAVAKYGPPKWEEAKFELKSDEAIQKIKMIYLYF